MCHRLLRGSQVAGVQARCVRFHHLVPQAGGPGRLRKYTIWNAHYGVSSSPIDCDMWQGTEKARINGYSGELDANISYMDDRRSAMNRIRLIASDMDATLLDGHSQLPPDFLASCEGAGRTGYPVRGCQRAAAVQLEEMFAPVLEQTLLVADNGGAVRWRGKDLFVSRMEPEVWHRLRPARRKTGIPLWSAGWRTLPAPL